MMLLLVGPMVRAQERAWEYWRNAEGYLEDQAEVLFGLIDRTLEANPAEAVVSGGKFAKASSAGRTSGKASSVGQKSGNTTSVERQLALAALDALVHDTRWDDSAQLHTFLDRRIGRVAERLAQPYRKKGVEVFKLYNDGFVVRTRSMTVGFDLCGTRGSVRFIPDSLMRPIVEGCDALFISHRDPDHADRRVVSMAAEMGIPVYGPMDYDNGEVQHVRMEDFQARELACAHGKAPLTVQALPGHQDDLQNNIYVVTFPEGYAVAHCGDQYRREDLAWLKGVSTKLARPLDILIIDCWAMEMKATIEGFAPRLVVSGHENEMLHTIDHREAFWLSQYKFDSMGLDIPFVILCWGEGYRLPR